MSGRISRYKWHLTRQLKTFDQAIVVTGLGRCGTTLLEESIIRYHHYRKHPKYPYLDRFEDVATFRNSFVYKTHDYPPKSLSDNVKLIFLFGNPFNTILSTHKMINKWGREHHFHLRSDRFIDNDSIIYQDTLNLQDLLANWMRPQAFEFMSIRYEKLYSASTLAALSDFLGFQVELFPFKARSTDWSSSSFASDLQTTYGALSQEIAELPDYRIWHTNTVV